MSYEPLSKENHTEQDPARLSHDQAFSHLPHDHGQAFEHLCSHMPQTSDFQVAAEIFKQLGDSSRIRIFWLLCHCEECVINISALMQMSSPAVSHHLRQLKTGGLITGRRKGKEVYYRAADTRQARLLHLFIEEIMEITCPSASEGENCP